MIGIQDSISMKKGEKMKKRISVLLLMATLLILSFGMTVHASGNTTDVLWVYKCNTSGVYTPYRNKMDDSWVYCNPRSGTRTKAKAYGSNNTTGTLTACSTENTIPVGVKGFITNTIYPTYSYGKLSLRPVSSSNTQNWGMWSVDSVWESGGVEY